jgi:protein-tyrosine-phosphatase
VRHTINNHDQEGADHVNHHLHRREAGEHSHENQPALAGEKTAAELDPALVRVASELEIALADAFPASLTSQAVQVADVIITLGEAIPSVVGVDLAKRRVRHWDLAVLAGRPDGGIRDVLCRA